jgi:threonine synthase
MEKQPKAHTTLLATAHPIKFANLPIDAYQYLKIQKNINADHDTRPSQVLQPDFSELKEWLLSH